MDSVAIWKGCHCLLQNFLHARNIRRVVKSIFVRQIRYQNVQFRTLWFQISSRNVVEPVTLLLWVKNLNIYIRNYAWFLFHSGVDLLLSFKFILNSYIFNGKISLLFVVSIVVISTHWWVCLALWWWFLPFLGCVLFCVWLFTPITLFSCFSWMLSAGSVETAAFVFKILLLIGEIEVLQLIFERFSLIVLRFFERSRSHRLASICWPVTVSRLKNLNYFWIIFFGGAFLNVLFKISFLRCVDFSLNFVGTFLHEIFNFRI